MSFLGLLLFLSGGLGAALGLGLVWSLYKSEGTSRAQTAKKWGVRAGGAFVCGSLTISLYLYVGSPEQAQQIAAYDLDEARALKVEFETEAKAEFDRANRILETAPKSPDALAHKAIAAAQLGHTRVAIAAARELVALDPNVPDGLILLAGLLTDDNDGLISPEAESLIDRALNAAPNHPRALYLSAEAAWQAGNTTDAMKRWSASFATGQGEWQVNVGKRMMAAAEEGRNGVPEPNVMAGILKGLAAQNQAQTQAETQAQRQEQAETQAEIEGMVAGLADRLAADPSNAQDWQRLVRSYIVLGEVDKVRAAFEDGLAAHPNHIKLLLLKAQWLRSLAGGATSETVALTQKVLNLDSENIEALWFMAVAVQDDTQAFELAILKLFAAVPPDDPRHERLQSLVAELRKEVQL